MIFLEIRLPKDNEYSLETIESLLANIAIGK